jgi:acyl-CoA synthetase (AMP-forming)/AMP-acid ligase II
MKSRPEHNFAGLLISRLGASSYLIDAATSETIDPEKLVGLVIAFAGKLLSAGLRADDRIAVGCLLSPASAIAYLGAMYAGLIPIPLEENALIASGGRLLQSAGVRAVWTEKKADLGWTEGTGVKLFHGLPDPAKTERNPPAARSETDLAVLMATSGSTGAPRFVLVSHGNLIANTEAIVESQRLANDETAMLILPLSYCFGASVFHSHLYQGGGVVFDRRFMFPDKVLHAINHYRCTTFAGVPTVYNLLLKRSNIRSIAMPGLRRFVQAGGPLAPQSVAEMRAAVSGPKFFVMYGQTEATARISCLEPERLDEKRGSVGRPLSNLTVRIVDETGREVSAGTTGELIVKGPSVSSGYLNDGDASSVVFRDGWLHTGDLGHSDEEGYLWIDGRLGGFVKMRGVRVSFAEVEAKLASVPGVYECAATSAPHLEVGEALVLFIVPEKGTEDPVERVRRSLPVTWTCDSIHVVSEIPKTSRGKIARSVLARDGKRNL